MTCPYCGKRLQDDDVFCPVCNTEVVKVPDYHSVESLIEQQSQIKNDSPQEPKKTKKKKKRLSPEMALQRRINQRRSRIIVCLVLAMIAALTVLGIRLYITTQRYNNFAYQFSKAEEAYLAGELDEAKVYCARSLTLDASDIEAKRLYALILEETQAPHEAIAVYRTLVEKAHATEDYRHLIRLLEADGDIEAVAEVLKKAPREVRREFKAYIPTTPLFVTPEGDYKEALQVILSAGEDNVIYYSLDGSDPTDDSQIYTGPIALPEGRSEVRAMSVCPKGLKSTVSIAVYNVFLPLPEKPIITPKSGNYTVNDVITVTIPEGCQAYYTFDSIPDETSEPYVGPVSMVRGNHIFSIIYINQFGKHSAAASETFIVQ